MVVSFSGSPAAFRWILLGVLTISPLPAAGQDDILDPELIPKFVSPMVVPPAMPQTSTVTRKGEKTAEYYEIAVRQFRQQILPAGLPQTTVWSYGSIHHPETFHYPSFTIEAKVKKPVRVKWINELVDAEGNYLPHLLPVDQTLHWANPPGGLEGRDMHSHNPEPYAGPVPIVTHVHGARTFQEFDGYPEAWYLPNAKNIPAGYATTGTFYDIFKQSAPNGILWEPGTAVFDYSNEQSAATLWYHDHSLGITRVNVYAGPAGFYLLRGGPYDLPGQSLPGPAPQQGDPMGLRYYEIPIAIQDRTFRSNGELFYPDSRTFFDGFEGPYIPDSDMSPIWNPEFFGNAMVVNGRTWPYLEVEARRYRLRFLNGSQSRFLILKMDGDLPFWQIGAEGGFLPKPVRLDQLLMGPAERADVIVDFSNIAPGTELILRNVGPDEPFGGGEPDEDFDAADPHTTGQVMQFRVMPRTSRDTSRPPEALVLPKQPRLPEATTVRQVSLNEVDSDELDDVGPRAALLGTMESGEAVPLGWMDAVTENPTTGETEIWEIHNHTMDAHPIHIHLVQFEVVDRESMMTGEKRPPELWESGPKDTVIAYPDEITRVKARFDLPGRFVWHCHILEHEDNEMMRPFDVLPPPDPAKTSGLTSLE